MMNDKNTTDWILCANYRTHNSHTVRDRYLLSRRQDITANLAGATIFSRIGLVSAYHKISSTADDIAKTSVIDLLRIL